MIGLLSGLLVGGACELVQLFEPGRVASVVDLLTNTAGGLLGAALVVAWSRRTAPVPAPRQSSAAATRPVPVQQA
jgi:VanZ family protein